MENLELTREWDKVFPQSDKVNHSKITFHNRYGITLAADLYIPKNAEGKLPAIAVSGPFGAVKEQASGLYAQTLAERGFLTIAFDPSYTGESGGHGGAVEADAVKFKIGYLKKMKEVLGDSRSVQDFVDGMKKAYPGLPDEAGLEDLGKALCK